MPDGDRVERLQRRPLSGKQLSTVFERMGDEFGPVLTGIEWLDDTAGRILALLRGWAKDDAKRRVKRIEADRGKPVLIPLKSAAAKERKPAGKMEKPERSRP